MVSLDRKGHVEYEGFLTEEESLFVASILRRDESKILGIPNWYPKTIYTGLTHQFNVYNFLTHPDIRILNIPDRIFNLPLFEPRKDNWYDELWVQCWGNVLHQGQEIKEHAHEYPKDPNLKIYACSIYLDGADPSYTHWEDGKQQNTRGTLHIVGREHRHHVKRNIHTRHAYHSPSIYGKKTQTIQKTIKDSCIFVETHNARPIDLEENATNPKETYMATV